MAKKIQAYYAYAPRVVPKGVVTEEELIAKVAARTDVSPEDTRAIIIALQEALQRAVLEEGRTVEQEGFATFSPDERRPGQMKVEMDESFMQALNENFTGEIVNRENMGMTEAEMIAKWNAEHPDDPIEE